MGLEGLALSQAALATKKPKDKKGIIAGIIFICYEILVGAIYGALFQVSDQEMASGDIVIIFGLMILILVGFGLMNTYVPSFSTSGFAINFLIMALTVQNYFFVRALWEAAGVKNQTFYKDNPFDKLTLANIGQDRASTSNLQSASIMDALACSLAIIVAYSSVLGKMKYITVFILVIIGSICYEVNNQLLWRLEITDIGYGMRVFLFGGAMGLLCALVIGRKRTEGHDNIHGSYFHQVLSLLGLSFAFVFFPFLCLASLYHTSQSHYLIQETAMLNMYLALGSGLIGSYAISNIFYRKSMAFDIIFSGLNGGIIYSSSSNLHRNPAVPLTIGLIVGILTSFRASWLYRKINKMDLLLGLAPPTRFLIPGFLAAIMSSILHTVGEGSDGDYKVFMGEGRSRFGQGGFQLIGLVLSICFGGVGGIIVGLICKKVNRGTLPKDYLTDESLFSKDQRQWSETDYFA